MIQKLRQTHSLAELVSIAGLPHSTYYYHVKRQDIPDKYAQIRQKIREIFHKNRGRYGYRRITLALHIEGYIINHKTVQRLMKEENLLFLVRMKKYRSYKGEVGKIAPNLLKRDFSSTAPN